MKPWIAIASIALLSAAGCQTPPARTPQPGVASPPVRVQPLAIQQSKAYGETVTGLFVPLVDFENSVDGSKGSAQVERFSVAPAGGARQFVVNITRTGAGAMEVTLPPKSRLVYAIDEVNNFTGYTLVQIALHSESLRDDLQLTLRSDSASWTSHRTLVLPGWNTVLIDIQRLGRQSGFDIAHVRTLELAFADAASDVVFHVDDIMLVNNTRRLSDTPKGIQIVKQGLDYRLEMPGRAAPVLLAQHEDGLWRMGWDQPVVQVAGVGDSPIGQAEALEPLGARKLGRVEILETNAVRVRLANTWYFPTRAGEWVSLAVRQLRWEYTLYGDGRTVVRAELNNSGGQEIGSLRVRLAQEAAWSGGQVERDYVIPRLDGPIARWSLLMAGGQPDGRQLLANYLDGGRVVSAIAGEGFAEGDVNQDRFDESQGCYYLQSRNGHCRFTVYPPAGGLVRPAFRIGGDWQGPVSVSSQGLIIRQVIQTPREILFVWPGTLQEPTVIEVAGKAGGGA